MKKIVFYNRTLMSGGIEKCIELLNYYLHNQYEIEVVYSFDDKLDPHIVEVLSKYVKVYCLGETSIECDLCVFCYLYFDYDKIMSQIKAKEYFCWIHSQPRALENCLLDNEQFVSKMSQFICVSEEVKNNLNISKEGIVIHNFINHDIQELANEGNPFDAEEELLKLVVVSRISVGKGFERLLKLVNELEEQKIHYSLKIVGKGRAKETEYRSWFTDYERVQFVGYQDNPYKYVKNADYLVLLSDYETWGNVISEAKALQVPCIVTDFPSAKEQIENYKNGIIVPRDLEDYGETVRGMIQKRKELKKNLEGFKYENEVKKWIELIQERELESTMDER